MTLDPDSSVPQAWLRSALVPVGVWPAVLVDHDLVIVWAPREVLERPPADLHVALVGDSSGATRWSISDVLVSGDAPDDDVDMLAAVRLYQSTGVNARRRPTDPDGLSRVRDKSSATSTLEDIGVLPPAWREARPPADLDGDRPSPGVVRIPRGLGAGTQNVWCKICPWWCEPVPPHPEPAAPLPSPVRLHRPPPLGDA